MSDQDIAIVLEKREVLGKAVKGLRRTGMVPAVIHDHGKDSVVVMAPYLPLYKAYQQAGKHHAVNLTVGAQKYLAMIKDVDFEPKKNQLRHVVFNAIDRNEKVETEVPINLGEDLPAERAGLMVLRTLDHVLVEALPDKLPDEVTADGSALVEIGDRLTVADVLIPADVTLLTEADQVIAVVEESAAQQAAAEAEAEAAEAEAAAAAEPESAADVPSEHGGDKDEEAPESEDQSS